MNLPIEISDYLNKITENIKKAIPVSKIYLFGSYAMGNYNVSSDLDLYVVTSDKSRRPIDLEVEVSRAIGTPRKMSIDILVNHQDEFEKRSMMFYTLEQQVVTKGIILYANK